MVYVPVSIYARHHVCDGGHFGAGTNLPAAPKRTKEPMPHLHKMRSDEASTIDDSHAVARTIDGVRVVTFQRRKKLLTGALPARSVDPAEVKKSAAASLGGRARVNDLIESSHIGLLFFYGVFDTFVDKSLLDTIQDCVNCFFFIPHKSIRAKRNHNGNQGE